MDERLLQLSRDERALLLRDASVPPLQSLRSRIFTAAAWGFGSQAVAQFLRFLLNIFLTHMLAPELFGLMAIASVLMIGMSMISDLGLGPNIIRSSRGRDSDFLNTAWTLQVLRGVVIWVMALAVAAIMFASEKYGLAPPGSVYADPRLPMIVAVVAVTGLIAGFTSTKVHEARRSLTVARLTLNEVLAQLAGMICILLWLSFDRSVWALIAGSIGNSVAIVLLSHASLPGISNRFRWDYAAVSELVRFGAWIFLSSLLSFGASNCDRLLLGGLLSSGLLGVYSVAYGLFSTIEQLAARMIVTIAFPALSETLRERPSHLSAIHYRFYRGAAVVMYALAGVLLVGAPEIVRLCYDDRYQDAGWMLQLLSLGLVSVPSQITIQVFIARGEPKLAAMVSFGRLLILFPAIVGGFHFFGVRGAIGGLALSFIAMVPLTCLISARRQLLRLKEELLPIPAFFAGLLFGQAAITAVSYLR
jgi:O-antigen/teichoic acid export membrane protein